jgi:hypothetical protein
MTSASLRVMHQIGANPYRGCSPFPLDLLAPGFCTIYPYLPQLVHKFLGLGIISGIGISVEKPSMLDNKFHCVGLEMHINQLDVHCSRTGAREVGIWRSHRAH